MLLALFLALFQTATDGQPLSRDPRPVRVWLGSSGVLTRGTAVRVYVQAAQDGNLIVLQRRTDGRINVVFPGQPNDDPFVRAGTYEIQATPSRVAFAVAEPDGSGLVLAALAPSAFRFDEFVRAAAWDPDALASSRDGSDGEGALSGIVQRMLGDGYFNYDIATYTVTPPVYATLRDTAVPYPTYPTCIDCTFIGFQQNVFEPLALCDPFLAPCIGDGRFHHRGRRRDEAPVAAPSHTIALSMRGSSGAVLIPQNGRVGGGGGFVRKSSTPANPPIEPRARAPRALPRERASLPLRAVPLGPGRSALASTPAPPAVATPRRSLSAQAEPTPSQVVRLTLTSTRVREEPVEAPTTTGSLVSTGLPVSPPVQPAARSRTLVSRPEAFTVYLAAPMMLRGRGLAVAGGESRAGAGGGAGPGAEATPTTGRTQGIALPPAVFHGAQARVPVTRTGVRRR